MTSVKKTTTDTEQIIDYLLQHPDFFIHHEALLNRLEIPHQTGPEVSSLLEYQVKKLQQENESMKKSARLLQQAHNDKHKLIRNIFELSLALYQAEGPDKVYEILNKGLGNLYSADYVHVIIFNNNYIKNSGRCFRYINPDSKIRFMFTELFNRNKALCDSLPAEYIQMLFAEDAELIRSTVLVPMNNDDWQGLMVLGSRQRDIYHYGLEIELLENICRVLTHRIDGYLQDTPVYTTITG